MELIIGHHLAIVRTLLLIQVNLTCRWSNSIDAVADNAMEESDNEHG